MSDYSDKEKFFKELLDDHYPEYHGKEVVYYCPNKQCHSRKALNKRKMSLNFTKDVFKCWTCGISGNRLYKLVKRIDPVKLKKWVKISEEDKEVVQIDSMREIIEGQDIKPLFEEQPFNRTVEVELPAGFRSFTDKVNARVHSQKFFEALGYLASRGLDEKDIIRYKTGYFNDSGKVCIPSFDEKGRLNYWITRVLKESKTVSKYYNPPIPKNVFIFNECNIKWDEKIILVEGVFDAIKCGPNAIPVLGSTVRNGDVVSMSQKNRLYHKILENRPPAVALCFDNDQAGDKAKKNIGLSLLDMNIEVHSVDYGNFKDPGTCTKFHMKESIDNSIPIDREELEFMELYE